MICCLIGTRAQLIKMAPVLCELDQRQLEYRLVFSGQHKSTMCELLDEFGVRQRPRLLYEGPEISGMAQMGLWLIRIFLRALTSRRSLLRPNGAGPHAMVVHGDTFSTLLGAVLGRLYGYKVVHVESGLTSGDLTQPFPEELTRRVVFRLAHIAFCPGNWAFSNMARYRVQAFDTGHNTIVDAVRIVLESSGADHSHDAGEPFAVVSLHRFENIFRRERLAFIVQTLVELGRRIRLVFVLHPATASQLDKFALRTQLDEPGRIDCVPRMTYLPFMRLIHQAQFVITDGGSNQEELAVLGKPTLLMRGATERREGLGETAVLSRYEPDVINRFVDDALASGAGRESPQALPADSPSARIVDGLKPFVSSGADSS